MEQWWSDDWPGKSDGTLREKSTLVLLYPAQISIEVIWN
jgi:hypothetical protein